jgi:hypothetical protein
LYSFDFAPVHYLCLWTNWSRLEIILWRGEAAPQNNL